MGDWAGLYLSLFLLMLVRYGADWQRNWGIHLRPFSILFPIWILTLYGAYLYETRFFRFSIDTLRAIGTAIFIALVASITAFYIFPPGLIYPRRNMVIFAAIYGVVLTLWRLGFYKIVGQRIKTNVLFLGSSPEVNELTEYFREHPHLGYTNAGVLDAASNGLNHINGTVAEKSVGLIVVSGDKNRGLTKNLFPLLSAGTTVIELEEFYERTLSKVSLEIFSDLWFIKNLENINAEVYKIVKRTSDILFGAIGLIFLAILYLPIAIAIKLNSPGPIIFKQKSIN